MSSHPVGVNPYEKMCQLVEDQAAIVDDLKFCVLAVIRAHARTIGHQRILEECEQAHILFQRLGIYRDAIMSHAERIKRENSRRGA